MSGRDYLKTPKNHQLLEAEKTIPARMKRRATTNQKKLLSAMALTFCLPLIFVAFAFCPMAPKALRHHREHTVADARTLVAMVRYVLTPEDETLDYGRQFHEEVVTHSRTDEISPGQCLQSPHPRYSVVQSSSIPVDLQARVLP